MSVCRFGPVRRKLRLSVSPHKSFSPTKELVFIGEYSEVVIRAEAILP